MIIFVYGTLKKGFAGNHILRNSVFLGACSTKKMYNLYTNGMYPCMVPSDEDGIKINGELYQIDIKTLQSLNIYEGVDSGLFALSVVEIDTDSCNIMDENMDSELVLGYIYLGPTSHMQKIKHWGKEINVKHGKD